VAVSRPVLVLVNDAFVKFTPVRTVFDISVNAKFAPVIFTLGPTMYPPLRVDIISLYGDVRTVGDGDALDPINLPVIVFVKFAFVKLTPSTRTNEMSVFLKFAPLRSMFGPIIYPPLTELSI
jgi:hypothetical protein